MIPLKPINALATLSQTVVIMISLVSPSLGQESPAPSSLVYSHTFTTEQGLSQNNVSAIVKDKDGFIWIGTGDGLNRFDGYSFTKYYHSDGDATSLSNDVVRSLLMDSNSRIWIGTYNGLNLYDSNTETFKSFLADSSQKSTISHNTVTCMMEDSKRQLWVGTYRGLNKIDLQTFEITNYYHNSDGTGLADNTVSALFEDKNGKVWVGTAKGINVMGKDGIETVILQRQTPGGLSSSLIADMVQDSSGAIYIGTNGGGLQRLESEDDRSFDYVSHSQKAYSLSSDVIANLALDTDGSLLVGTDGEGLYRYTERGKFLKILGRESRVLDHAGIHVVFIDDQDNYWLGLFGAGLMFVPGRQPRFEHYKFFDASMERIGKNSVLSIVEDLDQKIWIGTDGAGLYKFDPSSKQFTQHLYSIPGANSLTTNVVKSLLVDDKNNLYIGTYAGGLNYLDTKKNVFTHYLHDSRDANSISTNHVWSLFQDHHKRIFVGQLGGLDEFIPESRTFRAITIPRSKLVTNQTASVFAMQEDHEGNIWMGTRLAGIHRYDPTTGSFKSFVNAVGNSSPFPSNEILDFELGTDGKLLIGTDNKGVILFDMEKFTFLKLIHEFAEESIPSILKDDSGSIWFTSFDGLHKFDPGDSKVHNFPMTDGLQGLQYNEGACLRSSTGEYYFGGTNGLNVFRSDQVFEDQSKPSVVFTRLTLFHNTVQINDKSGILKRSILKSKEITLQPDQNVFSIEFACLEYRFPKKNKYRYQLEGFDKVWNAIDENRTATYTNLPPGGYTLKVSASNGDGYWNNDAASLEIIVIPRWYQMLYAQVAFAGLMIVFMLAIIHVRTRFLFRQKRKLESLVKIRTELIAAQKEEINHKNQSLEHAYEEVKSVNDELHSMNTNLEKLVEDRTEELRETIDKLIETDKGLDTFLYRSSHDLRGPITSLLGLAQIAKIENQQEGLNLCFESMENISNRMLRLLKRLNDTGVLFRGRLVSESINIDEFIKSITPEIDRYNKCKVVTVEIENKVVEPIVSDPVLITGIVLNLVENGIVFKGLNSPFVKCAFAQERGCLTIVVVDNGIGISTNDRDRIFDMFYRGSEQSTGNGLGLFMVKKALEILHGSIEIDSEPHSWTTVKVRIPLNGLSS